MRLIWGDPRVPDPVGALDLEALVELLHVHPDVSREAKVDFLADGVTWERKAKRGQRAPTRTRSRERAKRDTLWTRTKTRVAVLRPYAGLGLVGPDVVAVEGAPFVLPSHVHRCHRWPRVAPPRIDAASARPCVPPVPPPARRHGDRAARAGRRGARSEERPPPHGCHGHRLVALARGNERSLQALNSLHVSPPSSPLPVFPPSLRLAISEDPGKINRGFLLPTPTNHESGIEV